MSKREARIALALLVGSFALTLTLGTLDPAALVRLNTAVLALALGALLVLIAGSL